MRILDLLFLFLAGLNILLWIPISELGNGDLFVIIFWSFVFLNQLSFILANYLYKRG